VPLALLVAAATVSLGAMRASAACTPIVYPLTGTYAHARRPLGGPGLLLDGGGTDVDAAWRWMHRILTGSATRRGGNVVVLTAHPDNAYTPWILQVAPFASARTIAIPSCAPRELIDPLAAYINGADAVFFAGGDQAHYVIWKGSRLIDAIRRLYARGGVVGGTSAGLAIQGQVVFDSVAADRVFKGDEDVATPDAVRNPFEPAISFTTHLFYWPPLAATITDTHFARRNRFGRLTAFMARILHDGLLSRRRVYGLGIDERSALCVDRDGIATLFEQPANGGYVTQGAFLLSGGPPENLKPGEPLRYSVEVSHLRIPGERYDLVHKAGPADRYTITVDGSKPPFYSRNPYGT
jgi:cyanophycinase-like exopeptidase